MSVLAIAHRAGNSLAALQAAVDIGADVVELDVHQHRGRLEVRHLRTAGWLPFLWDRWELVPASAPRLHLRDVLAAAKAGTMFMLDLKGRSASVGESVAQVLHEMVPDRPVIVCGRHWPSVQAFDGIPWVRRVYSARTAAEMARLRLEVTTTPVYGVSVHRSLLTRALVAELHASVQVVMTWPVNDIASLERALAMGVTGIISDEPAVLRDLRSR